MNFDTFFQLVVKRYLGGVLLSLTLLNSHLSFAEGQQQESESKVAKLSWFIPDGLRADPQVFNIFQWAREGKLPNIKKMMEMGSYGYSIPVFPSHTPANFAALVTGMYPRTNGIPDGPMRIEGKALEKPSVGGFSSAARKVPAIWGELGQDRSVVLLSMPGSTPPELKQNAITIRGRWGGWGADLHSVIYEKMSIEQRTKLARNSRLFMQGMELTQYIDPNSALKWPSTTPKSKESFLRFEFFNLPFYAKLQQKDNASGSKYDSIVISRDMEKVDASIKKGQWSKWIPVTVIWNDRKVKTNVKFNLIAIGPGDFFRIRLVADNLNDFIVDPSLASAEIESDIGPMVDFPDNFPSQLVYYPEDKKVFLDEANMSLKWHRDVVDSIYKRYKPDIFLHDIYTPNQMLTSRWWMGYIDPSSERYGDVSKLERDKLWLEVMDMYKGIDDIVGKTMQNADKDTVIVLSSDHGAIPLNKSVQLNNLFAKKGWITYDINPKTGEPVIDWEKSKVVFLKMSNIYINPRGLGPVYQRTSGEDYDELRAQVIRALEELRDEKGIAPLDAAVKWEDVDSVLKLPADRTGDLVVANKPGYGWSEDITANLQVFSIPLETGYKQAVFADNVQGLWAPFIIIGKGIKHNYQIKEPIRNVDQLPTIFRAMHIDLPQKVEGRTVNEIFK